MAEESPFIGATAGMYSGIDWMTMIDQLMAIERRRILIWEKQKEDYKLEQDAWRDVNMRFSNLKDRCDDLLKDETWEKTKITSTDTEYVEAEDAGGAVAGTYDFRIRQLATPSVLKSSDELNTHASQVSQEEVISGINTVDLTTTTNTWTQFDPDVDPNQVITVTTREGINYYTTEIWLGGVDTIEELMSAVSTIGDANVLMRYDSERDRFILETETLGGGGEIVSLTSTATTGNFWEAAKFQTGDINDITNETGIDPTVKLSEANFDERLSTSSGKLKINGVTISWRDSWSINTVMSAINTSAAGVNAFYDESLDKVLLTHKYTGPRSIEVYDEEGNLGAVLRIAGVDEEDGKSAVFTVNSTSADDEISKDSNTFTIGGVKFTLKKTNVTDSRYEEASPITVTVERDIDAIKGAIEAWVEQWNSAMSFLRSKLHYDQLTQEAGELTGSGTALSIQNQIYTMTTDAYDEEYAGEPILATDMNQLAHIGITLGAFRGGAEGKLVIDDDVLTKALNERLQDVEDLFGVAKDGGLVKDYGVAYEMYEYTYDLTKGTGIIAGQIDLYTNPHKTGLIDMIDQQIEDYEEYLEEYEDRMRREFEAMEIAMANLKAQLQMLGVYY
jgi:flagellar capping protein FliD